MPIEWKVTLAVSGPITVEQRTTFNAKKGSENPFWTKIQVTAAQHGVKIELVARADNQEDANEAALYFVGQALDYLCLLINLPLYVSLSGTQFRPVNDNVKRILRKNDWENCFQQSREIGLERRTFSRSISWYRKAMVSENPIDSFLSYWSSLESLGSKFAQDNPRTQNGIINKICDCFDQIWNSCDSWKVIPNQVDKVNEFHELRNGIAHGFISVDIETLKRITQELPIIKRLAYEFLKDWDYRDRNPELYQNA
ncbi:MAG: hypothetical protein FVQ84_02390 [Planctomycetes bacterium]|nr:hypothetical protein [Planctomycetota bacterium]